MPAQSLVLARNDFESIIDDMAAHFKSDSRAQSYSTESKVLNELYGGLEPVSLAVSSLSDSGNDQVISKFTGDCKADLNTDSAAFHSKTSDYTTALQSSQNQDEFSRRIDEMADKAKRDNASAIDRWREKAKQINKENPGAGNAILIAFESVCALANKVYSAIVDFFTSIVQSVVKWLANAWSSIKNFFSDVSHLISGWF
ncbi:hypothetical protein OO306_18960 [Pseudomonas sp. DCB_AW]|jgi:hypothetical protein|uniref:hypothetical protein n=1 Tax=Pseudomonas sp. DCB_AW TaxID=2993596 RepID=UPI0022489A5D|nr:hypothetical protein [Pseudomonas sp. DCB_AW]MCX2687617.1 hypothetical protein [Pseudomonas sp. DCB_AW]